MRITSTSGLRSLGFLLLCAAQTLVAVGQEVQPEPEKQVDPCLASTCRNAPFRENLTAIGSKGLLTKYVRGIIGGFAQGAGLAGGVQFTSADTIPHMEMRATALMSSGRDQRFDLESIFTFAGTRNHADVWFSYMHRQNDFFGIGSSTSDEIRSSFASDQRSYQASLYRDLTGHLQGGVYGQVMNSHSGPGKDKADPSISDRFSGMPTPSIEQWTPGLLSTTQIASYGAFLRFDTRNTSADLLRGLDLYARVASNDGMKGHATFADYGWFEGEFDARGYIPLRSTRTSLALRSRGLIQKTKGGSQIPFYDLSYLGGREYVRGYDSYRFRGNNLFLLSGELRQTVYRKTDQRGVDVFGFADSGQVWGDSRSTSDPAILANQDFSSSNWRTGVGGGLQYRHSRSLAGRVELGRSNEGVKLYISLSRGF